MINFDPVTLREHFKHWLDWRVTAAHKFCLDCMRTNRETSEGNQNIMQAPVAWYVPRFVAAWRLGKLYIIRTKRELRRISKTVK